MRKILIYWLFLTLSVKKQVELSNKLLQTAARSIKIAKAKGSKHRYPSNRKRGPRGPYKKTKYVPTQETVLPRVESTKPLYSEKLNPIPDTNPYNDTKYKYTKTFAKMKVGDITWFKRPRQNISSIACTYGKANRKTFECRAIGKNSTEVKRVF